MNALMHGWRDTFIFIRIVCVLHVAVGHLKMYVKRERCDTKMSLYTLKDDVVPYVYAPFCGA